MVLFLRRLGAREVHVAGVMTRPTEAWTGQMPRNIVKEAWGLPVSRVVPDPGPRRETLPRLLHARPHDYLDHTSAGFQGGVAHGSRLYLCQERTQILAKEHHARADTGLDSAQGLP
jgi:hypothetical protein